MNGFDGLAWLLVLFALLHVMTDVADIGADAGGSCD
jgi:hypothetical protein